MSDLRTCPVCGQTKESSKFYKSREECRSCVKKGLTLENDIELPQVGESALETLTAPSIGLGDTIEKITTATGIKSAVRAVFGDDCGCEERKETLNKMFSFKTKECMTEEELSFVQNYVDNFNGMRLLKIGDAAIIHKIWDRVFAKKHDPNACFSCQKARTVSKLNDLMKIAQQ